MKKTMKRTAAVALAGVLVSGMFTGCSTMVDGTKTVATVNGENIPMGLLSLAVRHQQSQTEQLYRMYFGEAYASSIWDTEADAGS